MMFTSAPGDSEAALHGLRVYGPAAVPDLLDLLKRSSPAQQAELLTLLGHIGDARAVDAIVGYAQALPPPAWTPGGASPELSPLDRHALLERRLMAIEALGKLRVASTVPVLERGGADRDRDVRRVSLEALVTQATPASFMALDRLARVAQEGGAVPPPGTGPPAEARFALIGGLRSLTGAARLGDWLEDPGALDLYLRALASAGQDRDGPWGAVIDAVGGAPATLSRLEALAARLPPQPANYVRAIASLLRTPAP